MYLFVLAIIVITGCAKDETLFENHDNLELKKAKVPLPFKGDFYAEPDMQSYPILISGLDPNDPNTYFPGRLYIRGTGTPFGKVDSEKSY